MKTRKHLILVAVVFALVAGLLGAGHLITIINNPAIVQASSKKACPTNRITDRRAFMEGLLFAQNMRFESLRFLNDKDMLAGLEGVKVLVENLPPSAEKYGLTPQLLHTDAEIRLRMHGIMVGTDIQPQHKKPGKCDSAATHSSIQNWRQAIDAKSDEDFLQFAGQTVRGDLFKTWGPPTLYINVTVTVFEEIRRAAFSIQVRVKEAARLSRNGAYCRAPIWDIGGVGGCSSDDLKEYVRECLRDYVDEFINDYLAANPKDRSSKEAP